ncbi:hypothetical protein [Mesorhizobium sp.]|nr:hypothetical protein [Mesorhizobium sp.]RWN62518.1 MAG: hypothetical protein EOS00_07435 [Mesorhizobium sp.]RWO01382.1 MAG: hypothetical protein EOS06_07985 [Mesorhizobium sp.]RWO55659.1 MAG: hypothetical protein EOS13_00815 [Mesorhizobium sp.]TIN29675.1 MAG: hypothetical protein E5Y19_02795 [Mesorhizobium sp.]TIN40929.1 MAG: hypothetical protein E5Y13_09005 [Mesorhizobium sp.]
MQNFSQGVAGVKRRSVQITLRGQKRPAEAAIVQGGASLKCHACRPEGQRLNGSLQANQLHGRKGLLPFNERITGLTDANRRFAENALPAEWRWSSLADQANSGKEDRGREESIFTLRELQ